MVSNYPKNIGNKLRRKLFPLKLLIRQKFPITNNFLLKKTDVEGNFSEKGVLFIHIPKAAGSSIRDSLDLKMKTEAVHLRIKDYQNLHFFRKKIPNYFIFAFVRNPFTRFLSGYYYCLENSYRFPEILNFRDFEDFSNKISFSRFAYVYIFLPETDFLLYKNKLSVDYIGRYENLEADFDYLRKKFNLKRLPHKNKSEKQKKDWRDYYTLEIAEQVYKRYKKDFDLWYPEEYDKLIRYIKKRNNLR